MSAGMSVDDNEPLAVFVAEGPHADEAVQALSPGVPPVTGENTTPFVAESSGMGPLTQERKAGASRGRSRLRRRKTINFRGSAVQRAIAERTKRDKREGEGADVSSEREIAFMRQKSGLTHEVSSPQAIYPEDVDLSQFGVADAANILVKAHRTRVRVDRLKKKHESTGKAEPDEKADRRHIKLTVRMMLGVRVAVGRQSNPLQQQEIQDDDFTEVDKYTFPPWGASGRLATPSHKLDKTFKFRDYAPRVFKKLREIFGIEEMGYMLSVAGNYDYLEFITNSKSGSFFFFSHDQRFIIKAMKPAEARFFRSIIQQYYHHFLKNPDSLLIQFCGMYRVKTGRKKIPFIVMKCVDGDTTKKIHAKYDLKGSSLGRAAREGEKVMKDNDLGEKQGKIHLGSQREAFLKSARAGAEFLRDVNVMDYSLLTSIHKIHPPAVDGEESARNYSDFYTFKDEASRNGGRERVSRAPSTSDGSRSDARNSGLFSSSFSNSQGSGNAIVRSDSTRRRTAPSSGESGAAEGLRLRSDGGIDSEVDGRPGSDIYFMGIIDILQTYGVRKHGETLFKSLKHDKYSISCVDPELYCERFIKFLTDHTD